MVHTITITPTTQQRTGLIILIVRPVVMILVTIPLQTITAISATIIIRILVYGTIVIVQIIVLKRVLVHVRLTVRVTVTRSPVAGHWRPSYTLLHSVSELALKHLVITVVINASIVITTASSKTTMDLIV